ncbi:MAG: hypothetical protein ACOCQH_03555, partial [Halanaerobiales bacterium]
LIRECGAQNDLIEYPEERKKLLEQQASKFSLNSLRTILQELASIESEIKYARNPRLLLELAVIEIVNTPDQNLSLRVEKLEDRLEKLLQDSTQDAIINKRDKKTQKSEAEEETGATTKSKEKTEPEETRGKSSSGDITGQLNIETICERWPHILEDVKDKDIKTHAFLIEGKPVDLSENRIVIQFPADKDFHKRGAEKKGALIRSVIKEQLDEAFEPVFVLAGEDYGNDSGKKKVTRGETKNNSTGELVREVARMFSGEIIKANPEVIEKKEVSEE